MNSPLLAAAGTGAWEMFIFAAAASLLFAGVRLFIQSRTPYKDSRDGGRNRRRSQNRPIRPQENILDARYMVFQPEAKKRVPTSCLPIMIMAPL